MNKKHEITLFETISENGKICYINPKYIMSISPQDKSSGCAITVQDAMTRTFWDKRTAKEVKDLIAGS